MSDTERPRTVLDKNDTLTGLFGSWDAIEAVLAGLPDDDWQTPTSLPGWTVHDVVAHIIGTSEDGSEVEFVFNATYRAWRRVA